MSDERDDPHDGWTVKDRIDREVWARLLERVTKTEDAA